MKMDQNLVEKTLNSISLSCVFSIAIRNDKFDLASRA